MMVFRDTCTIHIKMRNFTVRINLTKEPERDDIIYFKRTDNPDVIMVTYAPGQSRSSYTFYSTVDKTDEYVWDMLRSLELDTDPFYKIQVTPNSAPAIIYEIADLSQRAVRSLIHTSIMRALQTEVENESSN